MRRLIRKLEQGIAVRVDVQPIRTLLDWGDDYSIRYSYLSFSCFWITESKKINCVFATRFTILGDPLINTIQLFHTFSKSIMALVYVTLAALACVFDSNPVISTF